MIPDKLTLYYPRKPFLINQVFGANPDYYSRFKDRYGFPEKGHPGLDLRAPHGEPIYAACDGLAHHAHDSHGGEGVVIRTGRFAYKDGMASFDVVHWHLIGDTDSKYPSPIKIDGTSTLVKTGTLIGYADNTGAPFESSGDHLHLGLTPYNDSGDAIESTNGFNGCIDPTLYFTGYYAEDYDTLITKFRSLILILQKWVGLLPH